LIAAVRNSARHVVLLGEPGCDHERLGRIIHQVSHRRHNLFYDMTARPELDSINHQALRDACHGTVLVHLHQKGKLDERIVAALVHPDARLRLIICAQSLDKVEASFPTGLVRDAKQIVIPPLRDRTGEISELLDQWFIARRSLLRFAVLRDPLRESLLSYTWPHNLQELRETADILVQLAYCRSTRQATKDSQISRGVLRGWAQKLNLKLHLPLIPNKAE
jgi:transcriptional regulator with AAA-type ATPase domain